jgi:hypothetical protein
VVKKTGALCALVVAVYVSCVLPESVAAYASPEREPAKTAVRCSVPGSEKCVQQCEQINAYCAHRATHPYSPSSGDGDLYYCESGGGQWQCRYRYTNGDTCTLQQPRARWKCLYSTP